MMKTYFTSITFEHWILFCVYSMIAVMISYAVYRSVCGFGSWAPVLAALGTAGYTIVAAADYFIDFLPFLPDSTSYTSILEDGAIRALAPGYLGFRNLAYFSGLRALCLSKAFLLIPFQVMLYSMASIAVIRAWSNMCRIQISGGLLARYALTAFLYPAGLLYITVPVREAFFIFFFSLALLGLSEYFARGFGISLIVGMIGVIMLRKSYFPALLLCLSLKHLQMLQRRITVALVMITVGFAGVGLFLHLNNIRVDAASLAAIRNIRIGKFQDSGNVYGVADWSSHFDIVRSLPHYVLQFVFAPMPLMWRGSFLSSSLAALDSLFVLALVLITLVLGRNLLKHRIWLSIALLLVVMSSIWEFYVFGAVRHRMPVVMMLFPLCATALERIVVRNRILHEAEFFHCRPSPPK